MQKVVVPKEIYYIFLQKKKKKFLVILDPLLVPAKS